MKLCCNDNFVAKGGVLCVWKILLCPVPDLLNHGIFHEFSTFYALIKYI